MTSPPLCFLLVATEDGATQRTAEDVQGLVEAVDGVLRAVHRTHLSRRALEDAFPNDARVTHSARQPTATGLTLVEGYDRTCVNVFLARSVWALGGRGGGTPTPDPVVHARQQCIILPDDADAAAFREALRTFSTPPREDVVAPSASPSGDGGLAEEAVLSQARALSKAESYAEARDCLLAGLRAYPDSFECLLALGQVYVKLGLPKEAETHLRTAHSRRPDDVRPLEDLSLLLFEQKRWEESMAVCSAARALAPHDKWLGLRHARCLEECGRVPDSVRELETLAEAHPTFLTGLRPLSRLLKESKQFAQCVSVSRLGLAADPQDEWLQLNLAISLEELGQVAESIAELEKLAELHPKFIHGLKRLGSLLQKAKRYDEAIRASRRAIEVDPQDVWVRSTLANSLEGRGDLADSMAELEKLIQVKPDFAWGYKDLSRLLMAQKQYQACLEVCKQGLQAVPDDKKLQARLAECAPLVAEQGAGAPRGNDVGVRASASPPPAPSAQAPGATVSPQAAPAPAAPTVPAPASSPPETLRVPVRLHLVVHPVHGTQRNAASARALVDAINSVWAQAGLHFEVISAGPVEVSTEALEKAFPHDPAAGRHDPAGLASLPSYDANALNLFLVRRVLMAGTDRAVRFHALAAARLVLCPDGMGTHPIDVPARCLCDVVGVKRDSTLPMDRLCRMDSSGTLLVEEEITIARVWASRLPPPPLSVEPSLTSQLDSVITASAVKDKITSLANYARIEMLRRKRGLTANPLDLHAVFSGPLGTARKRLARLLARLYQESGVPCSGQIRELSGEEFLQAPVSGGILILDELVRRDARSTVTVSDRETSTSRSSMADEVQRLAVLVRTAMKNDTTVLLIGTKEETAALFAADGSLAATLRNRIESDHYDLDMLLQLFEHLRSGRGLEITAEGQTSVEKVLRTAWEQRDADFSNGRRVARLFEDIVERQANRLIKLTSPTDRDFNTITAEDIPGFKVESGSRRAKESWLNASFTSTEVPPDDTLEQALADLDALIGLDKVKQKVHSLVRYISVQQRRLAEGLAATPVALHLAFVGPPGTGKTTVARLMGRILKSLGLLTRGHTIETDRTGFIAAYRGQTSLKSNETIHQALHGVLFIDEAYTLTSASRDDDYGQEAIGVLLKRMEDDRGKISVIVAGYSKEMQRFFDANSGLRSRFTQTIQFEDYTVPELLSIFESFCASGRYVLTDGARRRLGEHLDWLHAQKGDQFGNGRLVRTLFEQTVERQATRLADDVAADLATLLEDDIHTPELAAVRAGDALKISDPPAGDSIEKVLAELDALVGLKEVKEKLRSFINLVRAEKQREQQGLGRTPTTLHLIFSGQPGTGKTTVARLIGRAYRALGLLRRGHLVETDRAGLVASYAGQTSPKVNQVVDRALHGVLFIDEAYALTGQHDAYGQEAVDILVKRLEDDREHLAVVLAGYTDPMKLFLNSNPGLRSRFQGTIDFPDYSPGEMVEIFTGFCRGQFTLTPDAVAKIRLRFEEAGLQQDAALGNGRLARQMFQEAVGRQANRLADSLDAEALRVLEVADIPDALPGQKKNLVVLEEERQSVAYHEVGHALVGALLPGGRKVERISIVPYGENDLGYTSYVEEDVRYAIKPEEIRNQIAILMGGLSAQEVKYGYVWSGAHGDIRNATRYADQYVKLYGMSRLGPVAAREISPALAQRIDEEVQALLDAAHRAALAILRGNRSLLDSTAGALLESNVLEGEAMQHWLSQATLPPELAEWRQSGTIA